MDRIHKSAEVVNENVLASRQKMKSKYDKRVSPHDIGIGDSVMLWWPYFMKDVPRSFQPRWKGPWTVIALYDETNCTIENEVGETKHVHLNQLKPVERRRIVSYPNSNNIPDIHKDQRTYVSFDQLVDDNSDNENNIGSENIINHAWCNVDESNILPSRTRNS